MSRTDPRAAQWRRPLIPIWRGPAQRTCLGEDTALFYPADGESLQARDVRAAKAKALCAGCCARGECLEAAMAEEGGKSGRYGIRGGLTPEERTSLLKSRVASARHARRQAEAAAESAA